jgi:dephospho-CoA kinase
VVPTTKRPRPVVLTGGIGSGKSSVGRLLSAFGAFVVDADALARDVVAAGTPGLAAVVAAFGPGVLGADGSLDRARLADQVFDAPDELARLEAIIHPLVQAAAAERLAAHRDATLLVYEVPLPGHSPFAEGPVVVVVDAPDDDRRARLRKRGMLDDGQIAARMDAQPSRRDWLALADVVVDNSGDEQALRAQVIRLWRLLTGEEAPVSPEG